MRETGHRLSSRAWSGSAAAIAAVFLSCLSACSSGGSSGQSGAFSGAPYTTATSTSGKLEAAVRFAAQPPAAGPVEAEITITSASDGGGTPVDGLTLQISPWMPNMRHGCDCEPTVTPGPNGTYVVNNLDLIMNGLWELKTTISGATTDGGVDTVNPEFQVP